MMTNLKRTVGRVGLWSVGIGAFAALGYCLPLLLANLRPAPTSEYSRPAVSLVGRDARSVEVEEASQHQMGLKTADVEASPAKTSLRLTGWLFIDPARLVHIHARFPGEVISLGASGGEGARRPLRVGDHLKAGDSLAVMWCREMGEKKSDLVDALSQLRLDERTLQRLRSIEGGAVAQRLIEEAERKVEADRIALSRAERTLKSWRLSDEEIARAKKEADHLQRSDTSQGLTPENVAAWAESKIRSPISGTLLEQNVVPGDIVDTSIDLFKLADLTRLGIAANVYEEDLRKIERLAPDERRWRLQMKADRDAPQVEGRFELISNLVDPTQHTATIVGWIDNPAGKLRVGQFITATIELPGVRDEVVIPQQAAIEDGPKCFVFVASADAAGPMQRRQVALRRFEHGRAYVRSTPDDSERQAGAEPLLVGERVVTSGAVELAGALAALRVQAVPEEVPRP